MIMSLCSVTAGGTDVSPLSIILSPQRVNTHAYFLPPKRTRNHHQHHHHALYQSTECLPVRLYVFARTKTSCIFNVGPGALGQLMAPAERFHSGVQLTQSSRDQLTCSEHSVSHCNTALGEDLRPH